MTPDHFDDFKRFVAESERRYRWHRVINHGGWGLQGAFALLLGWCALRFFLPALAPLSVWVVGILATLTIGGLGLIGFLPIRRSRLGQWMDREYRLPNSILSAIEFQDAELSEQWKNLQLADTIQRLKNSKRQPLPSSGKVFSALAMSCLIVAMIGLFLPVTNASRAMVPEVALSGEQAADLEDLFKDWEQAEQKDSDPVLEQMLRELEPFRKQLAEGKATPRETFLELSKLEDKIAQVQQKLAAQSLDSFAADLSEALGQAGGMEALAKALKERDYEGAEKAARELEAKQAADTASLPPALQPAETQEKLSKLGQKLSQAGQSAMGQAVQSLSQAGKNSSSSDFKDGLKKMCQSLGQQNALGQQCKKLALQCNQLGMCKSCLGNGESMCQGMSLLPKLSLVKSQNPGKGAGSATDPNRQILPTDQMPAGVHEQVSGTSNESGESETSIVSSEEAPRQQTVSVSTANLDAYRKLSEEAVEDESLPLAHRQTIRRYFEMIRGQPAP